MRLQRHVVVFDAADIDAESTFWARLLGGRVFADDTFHCVLDGDGHPSDETVKKQFETLPNPPQPRI